MTAVHDHSLCSACWNARHPRLGVGENLVEGRAERCCNCGKTHRAGLFLRAPIEGFARCPVARELAELVREGSVTVVTPFDVVDERKPYDPPEVRRVEPAKVTGVEEYRHVVASIVIAAGIVAQWDLDELISQCERSRDVGWMFDPTLWKEKVGALEQDLELLRAALPLVRLHRKLTGGGAMKRARVENPDHAEAAALAGAYVRRALGRIEDAQNHLRAAREELSALVGAVPEWEKTGALQDKVHQHWYRVRDRLRALEEAGRLRVDAEHLAQHRKRQADPASPLPPLGASAFGGAPRRAQLPDGTPCVCTPGSPEDGCPLHDRTVRR